MYVAVLNCSALSFVMKNRCSSFRNHDKATHAVPAGVIGVSSHISSSFNV